MSNLSQDEARDSVVQGGRKLSGYSPDALIRAHAAANGEGTDYVAGSPHLPHSALQTRLLGKIRTSVESVIARTGHKVVSILRPDGVFAAYQDADWYPRRRKLDAAADKISYYSWRLTQGQLRAGAKTRIRRILGSFGESLPADMTEYHVVRHGLDERALATLLEGHRGAGATARGGRFMTTSRAQAAPLGAVSPHEEIPRGVAVVWFLMLVNTLGFTAVPTIIPFPQIVGQMITMSALMGALAIAIMINPRLQVQPNAFLLLLSLLMVVSIASSLRMESGSGALFRCFRGTVFLATLWLMSHWWRTGLRLARYHVQVMGAVLLTVAVGLGDPGKAYPAVYGGRLVGALWPIPPPQVGHYAAVTAGLAFILWLTKQVDTRSSALFAVPAVVLLLLSHTRTALIGLIAGVLVAIISLVLSSARARIAVTGTALLSVVAAVELSAISTWLARGQDSDQLTSLTGRQKVWDALLAEDRSPSDVLLGVGLTNKSYNGLPIDSGWLAVYYEQGLIGVGLVILVFLALFTAAAMRPPSAARSCGVFLICYVLVASYTETGLGDASPYFLDLMVAAAVLSRARPVGPPVQPLSGRPT